MSTRYELTTLQDVWEKVPSDRIMDCLTELGQLMQSTKATAELLVESAKASGVVKADTTVAGFGFKYPLVWEDDGKKELRTDFTASGTKFMTLKIKKDA